MVDEYIAKGKNEVEIVSFLFKESFFLNTDP